MNSRRRSLVQRARAIALVGAGCFGLGACVRAPAAELERRASAIERERDPDRLLARAHAFASVGDYPRAEQYLEAARAAGVEEAQIVPLLLEVCVRDRRYRSAVEHAEEYLRVRPSDLRVRLVLASLYSGLGEAEAARREFERVVLQNSREARAHFALGRLLRDELGHHAAADAHFRAYLEIEPRGMHAEEARSSLLTRVR